MKMQACQFWWQIKEFMGSGQIDKIEFTLPCQFRKQIEFAEERWILGGTTQNVRCTKKFCLLNSIDGYGQSALAINLWNLQKIKIHKLM